MTSASHLILGATNENIPPLRLIFKQATQVVSGIKSTAAKVKTTMQVKKAPIPMPRIHHPMDRDSEAGFPLLRHFQTQWAHMHAASAESASHANIIRHSISGMKANVHQVANGYVHMYRTTAVLCGLSALIFLTADSMP